MGGLLLGTVLFFDGRRGTGEVEGRDGRRFPFHCTAVADGSRAVAVGTSVVFAAVPGRLGRLEAVAITSLTD